MTPDEIRKARAADRRSRARDFADSHGIAEAALLAAFTGPEVVHVMADPARLLPLAAELGEALALTRNASAVQERQGRYRPPCGVAGMEGDGISLRIALEHWVHAFSVTEPTAKATRRSIQVFDASGEAVHKIHLTPESDVEAFRRLTEELRLPDQPDSLPLRPGGAAGDGFGPPLRRLRQLAPAAVTALLEEAAAAGLPLEIRSGNAGCQQIYRGPVERILPAGYWINVMDPRFNLHLRTDHLAEVWVTESEAAESPVVEALDSSGARIIRFAAPEGAEAFRRLTGRLPTP